MGMPRDREKPLDPSTSQSNENEMVKLICKLRWIGLEDEAERVLAELRQRREAAVDNVFTTAGETD